MKDNKNNIKTAGIHIEMGLYWQTVFFSKKNSIGIVLNSLDKIIDEDDERRGFVCKHQLVKFFKAVKEQDIVEESYIVEYYSDTYGGCSEQIIPVK